MSQNLILKMLIGIKNYKLRFFLIGFYNISRIASRFWIYFQNMRREAKAHKD